MRISAGDTVGYRCDAAQYNLGQDFGKGILDLVLDDFMSEVHFERKFSVDDIMLQYTAYLFS